MVPYSIRRYIGNNNFCDIKDKCAVNYHDSSGNHGT